MNIGQNQKKLFDLAFLHFSVNCLSQISIWQREVRGVMYFSSENNFCSPRIDSIFTVDDTQKSAWQSSPQFCGEHRQSANRFSESTLSSCLWIRKKNIDSCFSPIKQFANTVSVFFTQYVTGQPPDHPLLPSCTLA